MNRKLVVRAVLLLLVATSAPLGVAQAQAPSTFVDGLLAPTRMVVTPQGNLLVAESGAGPGSGRISIVGPGGDRRTLVDGLPSGMSAEGAASGPSGLAIRGRRLYVTIGTGDAVVSGGAPGTEAPNPAPSSPILSSVLEIKFAAGVERKTDGFSLVADDHVALAAGARVKLRDAGRRKMTVRLVADFADFVPAPRPDAPDNVRASNPFGVAVDGDDLYVADASMNVLLRVDVGTGATETLATFAPLPNPLPFGPPVVEFVPDTVRIDGESLLVTGLTGFPFPQGSAEVRRVDAATGEVTTVVTGLTSAIDLLAEGDGTLYVLEFSSNMLAAVPAPGRLVRFATPDAEPEIVADGLVSPTGLVRGPASGDLFVSEIFTGRVLRIAE